MRKFKNNRTEEGFDILEILIVVPMIMIVMVAGILLFNNMQKQALELARALDERDAVKTDVKNTVASITTALIKDPTANIITANKESETLTITVGNSVLDNIETTSTEAKIYAGGRWDGFWVLATQGFWFLAPQDALISVPEGNWDSPDNLTVVNEDTMPYVEDGNSYAVFYNSVSKETTVYGD